MAVAESMEIASDKETFKYWAFVSYSHRDKKWGDWLHKALETYRVPSRLVGRETRNGKVPRRIYPIFRDREELPTSADLGHSIREALGQSRYLIIICSPNAANSMWVNEEIKTFKAMGRENRILCLIVDGEPNASDKPELDLQECFPEALRFHIDAKGEVTDERTEPIAADLREDKDGREDAKLKLLAGVIGVGFDDLRQREKARQRARQIQVAAASLAAIVVAGGIWFVGEQKAQEEAWEKARQKSLRVAELSRKEIKAGNFELAMRLALETLPSDLVRDKHRLFPESLGTLGGALLSDSRSALLSEHDKRVLIAWSNLSDDFLLTYQSEGIVGDPILWNTHSGRKIATLKSVNMWAYMSVSSDGTKLLTADSRLDLWDTKTGQRLRHSKLPGFVPWRRMSPSGDRLAVASRFRVEQFQERKEDKEKFPREPTLESIRAYASCIEALPSEEIGLNLLRHYTRCISAHHENHISILTGENYDITSVVIPIPPTRFRPLPQLSFSSDSLLLARGTSNGETLIWDVKSGELISVLKGHADGIRAMSFSRASDRLVTVSQFTAKVWNTKTQEVNANLKEVGQYPQSVSFDPTGKRILIEYTSAPPSLWDAVTGEKLENFLRETPQAMAFSPSGEILATSTNDGTIHLWHADSQRLITLLGKHGARVTSLSFSPSGRRLASGGKDGSVLLWNLPILVSTLEGARTLSSNLILDGRSFYTGDDRGSVRIWETKTGSLVREISTSEGRPAVSLMSPRGDRIVLASEERPVQVLDTDTGRILFDLGEEKLKDIYKSIFLVRFSPSGRHILVSLPDMPIRVFDSASGTVKAVFGESTKDIFALGFDRPETRVATNDDEFGSRIWETATGRVSLTLPKVDGVEQVALFTPFPDKLLVFSISESEVPKMVDSKTGEELLTFGRAERQVKPTFLIGNSLSDVTNLFSPSGDRVLIPGPNNNIVIHNAMTGRPIVHLRGHTGEVISASFIYSGERVVTVSLDGTVRLWEASSGLPLVILQGPKPTNLMGGGFESVFSIPTVSFSPEGGQMLVKFADGKIRIYRTERINGSPQDLIDIARAMSKGQLTKEERKRYDLGPPKAANDNNLLPIPQAKWGEPGPNECDFKAADPYDPKRVVKGIDTERLEVGQAIEACCNAIKAYPGVTRFRYQLFRALNDFPDELRRNYKKKEYGDEAIIHLSAAAADNYPAALRELGKRYLRGYKVAKSVETAIQFFTRASEAGVSLAKYDLAKRYQKIEGIPRNEERNRRLLDDLTSRAFPLRFRDIAQDLDRYSADQGNQKWLALAFVYYVIAERLFEEIGDMSEARAAQARRVSLARTLPVHLVTDAYRLAMAWRPGQFLKFEGLEAEAAN